MAIKASATITIFNVDDIAGTTRYYKLVASGSSAPSKPAENADPDSTWTKTEPSVDTSKVLYFVDQTLWSNGAKTYSEVSKSSSYEAAKEAYNKAVAAAKTAKNFMEYNPKDGLLVGNKIGESWSGYRSQMLPTAFNILDENGNVLSSFGANNIYLGKNNRSSIIDLCDGLGTIRAEDADDTAYKRLIISTDDYSTDCSMIGLKSENFECSGEYHDPTTNNTGMALMQMHTYRPWDPNESSEVEPYITLHSKIIRDDGTYKDNINARLFLDASVRNSPTIAMSAWSNVNTDSISAYGEAVGIDITPWNRTPFTTDFAGGNIKLYGAPVRITDGLELRHDTPYIDFHFGDSFGNSTENYTSRIIESASGTLNVLANLQVKGTAVSLSGHTHYELHNTTANKDLKFIKDGDYCFFIPDNKGTSFAICGSNGNPWYKTYTERLNVTKERIVCKPTVDTTTTYAANVYVGTTGIFTKYKASTSSKYIKHDIKELQDESINAERLYDVDVVQFKYNEGELPDDDQRYLKDLPGFIIENMAEVYPIAVDKQTEDSKGWSWNDHYIIPPMLKLIQMQHEEIEAIKAEIKEIRKE